MTAAIYFHPEAYTTVGPKLMGRNGAAELVQAIPAERQPFIFRTLVWLVKLGILKVCA